MPDKNMVNPSLLNELQEHYGASTKVHDLQENTAFRSYGLETAYMSAVFIEFKEPTNPHQRHMLRRRGWSKVKKIAPSKESLWVNYLHIKSDEHPDYQRAISHNVSVWHRASEDARESEKYRSLNAWQKALLPIYFMKDLMPRRNETDRALEKYVIHIRI
jgi:hypothetical protein